MRILTHEFQTYQTLPDGRVSVPLGSDHLTTSVRGLVAGDHVWLIAPLEFMTEAVVEDPVQTADGDRYWRAAFSGWSALVDLLLPEGHTLPFPVGFDGVVESTQAACEREED